MDLLPCLLASKLHLHLEVVEVFVKEGMVIIMVITPPVIMVAEGSIIASQSMMAQNKFKLAMAQV
jgi:hypothetical protein